MNEPQHLPAPESFQTVAAARTMRARIAAASAATLRKLISSKNRLHRLHAADPKFRLEPLRKFISAAAKRYFDLLKNALVVATIGYLSGRAQSPILSIVAWVSFVLFMMDWMLSLLTRDFTPFSPMQSKTWAAILNGLFTLAVFLLGGILFWFVVFALDEFARAQSH
jgi:hypothetical protein